MNLFFSFGVSRCLVLKNIFSCFQCPLLNISYCPATEVDLSLGKKLVRWISSDFLFFIFFCQFIEEMEYIVFSKYIIF